MEKRRIPETTVAQDQHSSFLYLISCVLSVTLCQHLSLVTLVPGSSAVNFVPLTITQMSTAANLEATSYSLKRTTLG